ncbi:hypothetical protein NQ315_016344 [Exocentrus adspersus]|uniref:Uncharacterized protein n=1 Tax=Exocentrus adspersus TaxID=1586481 RepID=A0AAV8VQR5_9CUCU|nr:hypothetical protein NQ315_016344 [Exocentrus adspersus]
MFVHSISVGQVGSGVSIVSPRQCTARLIVKVRRVSDLRARSNFSLKILRKDIDVFIQHERESCINNVKLNLNCTKDYSQRRRVDNGTYTKRPKPRFKRGSLENVSHPWGEPGFDAQSSLRRTRSLAVDGERIFSSLDYSGSGQRRSQLIPRARLITRSSVRENRFKENLDASRLWRRSQPSISPPDYSPPQPSYIDQRRQLQTIEHDIYSYASLQNIPETTRQEDSLDSNYDNRTSTNSPCKVSYEDLPELSLPNYYPDSKYDTDNTDNFSVIELDNVSSVSLDNQDSKTEFPSFDNLEFNRESISYDENIVLAAKKSLSESKPKTIRRPTPYSESLHSYGTVNPNSLSDEETTEVGVETDKNQDEVNEDVARVIEVNIGKDSSDCSSLTSTGRNSPCKLVEEERCETPIKTLIEVAADDEAEYKTVVSVDTRPEKKEEKHSRREGKHHSHNYLREFLETQKGSRKPLQNFIAKKFSNLSRKGSKDASNLSDNQFHSLPDITVSKNLRKCEKIDRKLRKCEKSAQFLKSSPAENRFIVNIGRHFDITANSNIPVDFEVKIAKVPKKNKKQAGTKTDEQLLAAVKSLKETLHGSQLHLDENQNVSKPEVVSVTTKDMAQNECTSKEYKEKLGTMRNYWDKMVGNAVTKEETTSTCKVVDLHTKVEDVKRMFEPNNEKQEEKPPSKVQLTKQLFEPKPVPEKVEKISPLIKETCNYFENNVSSYFDNERQFESLCPSAVEIVDKPKAKPRSKKPACKTKSSCEPPEFDHVRYKVVKSDLFQKKIFAKCEKESQFDGLMQYLQDYSFQELLIDNNIVIIEPIRSKVHYEPAKSSKNATPSSRKRLEEAEEDKPGLNRHFFYHPIRVNREVNDDELPNPDTVRQVRQLFEGGLKRCKSSEHLEEEEEEEKVEDKYRSNSTDPDKDRCSATDSNSHSDTGSQENLYDSIDNEIYCEYVSEDILEKIREHGTTVTYYGGRVVDQKEGQPVLTKAIMEEIRNNEKRCRDCSNCRKYALEKAADNKNKEEYVGVKFRILKSNSCSSRLELVGAEDVQEAKKKIISQHKKSSKKKTVEKDKNAINESIKKQSRDQPKIIGEERKVPENKYVQWGELKKETSFANIQFNDKKSNKIYDYHNYDKIKTRSKKIDDMEFEPYEVA